MSTTLHTVNKSPYAQDALRCCLDHVSAGDTVLLIEDGVLAARKNGAFVKALAASGCTVCALGPDLSAREIVAGDVAEGIHTVDYGGFVDLAASAARVCAWL